MECLCQQKMDKEDLAEGVCKILANHEKKCLGGGKRRNGAMEKIEKIDTHRKLLAVLRGQSRQKYIIPEDYDGPVCVITYNHYYSGTCYAPDPVSLQDRVWSGGAAAAMLSLGILQNPGSVDGTYYLAHGQYERPEHMIVAATDVLRKRIRDSVNGW